MAFRNRRDLTFEDTGKLWGFDQRGFAHGMAFVIGLHGRGAPPAFALGCL